MAVAFRAGGTANVSGTAVGSIATTTPATAESVAEGDLRDDVTILSVVAKPFNTTIGTISGWTKITEFASGSTANGLETGSTKTAVYYKVGAASSAVVSVGPALSGADTATCGCVTYSNATGRWDVSGFVTAADDANAANFSATSGSNLALDNGDILIANVGLNSDNGTTSAVSLQGTTTGVTTRQTANTSTGNDSKLMMTDRAQSSSTNTTVAFSYTNASSTAGGVIFLRVREVTQVTTTIAESWAVLQQVTDTIAESWNVRTTVVDTTAESWHVRTSVTDSVAESWAVRSQVLDSIAESWAVLQQVTSPVAESWHVRATVTDSIAESWAVRTAVTDSIATSWAVRQQILSTVATSWDVRATITTTVAESWAVRTQVLTSIATSWDVAGSLTTVVTTIATSWNVGQTITAPISTAWHVRQAVADAISTSWAVRTVVTDDTGTSWAVLEQVTDETSTSWAVLQEVLDSVDSSWAVLQQVVDTTDILWNTEGPTIVLPIRFTVSGPLGDTFTVVAGERLPLTVSLEELA